MNKCQVRAKEVWQYKAERGSLRRRQRLARRDNPTKTIECATNKRRRGRLRSTNPTPGTLPKEFGSGLGAEVDPRGENCSRKGRDDKQPQLPERPAPHKHCRSDAARGIDGCVGYGNAAEN